MLASLPTRAVGDAAERGGGGGGEGRVVRGDAYRWAERWVPPAEPVNVFLSPPFPDLTGKAEDMLSIVKEIQSACAGRQRPHAPGRGVGHPRQTPRARQVGRPQVRAQPRPVLGEGRPRRDAERRAVARRGPVGRSRDTPDERSRRSPVSPCTQGERRSGGSCAGLHGIVAEGLKMWPVGP